MNDYSERIAMLSPEKRELLEKLLEEEGSEFNSFPLSFAQQRLWFLDRLESGNPSYNIPVAVHLRGLLNLVALEQSFNEIVRRHETLRTTFATVNGQPFQIIAPSLTLTLPVVDLRQLLEIEQSKEIQRLATEEAEKPFDLTHGALLRVTLLQLTEGEHVLLLTMHHIISDGWSMKVLVKELGALYEAFSTGQPSPLPELSIQYADFVHWQRQWLQGEILNVQLTYWKQQLASAPVLELLTTYPRPAEQTFQGARLLLVLPQPLTEAMKRLSREEEATPFMTLLAAFQILLSRYCGQEDIIVGTPIAGRHQRETEELIGLFLNSLAIRTNLSGNPSFRELLSRVREITLEAYAHQDLPFEKLVEVLQPERDLSRNPIFDVMLNFVNTPKKDIELSGLTLTLLLEQTDPQSKFAITLYVREDSGQLSLELVYQQALFSAEFMACFLQQFQYLLEQIIATPDRPIQDYSLVTSVSQGFLPDPSAPLQEPYYEPVPTLFRTWAKGTPHQTALCQGEQSWTYSELAQSAQTLAQTLVTLGVKPGEVVAISGLRSFGLIVSMLGVLSCGGVLLTLDPNLPPQRQQLMLSEAKAQRLLYIGGQLPEHEGLWEDLEIILIDPDTGQGRGMLSPFPLPHSLPLISPNDAAYIFFTSGTTGVPKGVLGCHKGLSHFLNWQQKTFAIGPHDRCAQLTGLSFDVVLRDIFLPLTSGATLCLPALEDTLSPTCILPWLEHQRISVLHTVPTLVQSWLANVPPDLSLCSLRWVFFAGEPLSEVLVRRWRKAFSEGGNIVNLYGPTETTLAKCYYRVPIESSSGIQPIGFPLPDTQALVLGSDRRLCGVGEPGEIAVRTFFRSLGYINASEEENQRFVKNPFRNDEKDLIYLTGDRGRYRSDGSLEILGRLDHQVKIRGVRIEPGEIETALEHHPDVQKALVLAQTDYPHPGDKNLVAYIVTNQEQLTPNTLRFFLRQKLPEYMMPAGMVFLEKIPLTPNGKVDRRSLPAPDTLSLWQSANFVPPSTPTEQVLAALWAEVLGLEQVGIHDSLFELGGHSLLIPQIISQVRDALSVELSVRCLFESPTVASLAKSIEAIQEEAEGDKADAITLLPEIIPAPEQRYQPFPLYDIQQAYWIGRMGGFALSVASISYMEFESPDLNLERLNWVWQKLIERHDTLRTVVLPDGQQQVLKQVDFYEIRLLDLRGQEWKAITAQIESIRQQMSQRKFQANQWPLFELRVTLISDRAVRLHFSRDLLLFDGWSSRILIRELLKLYENPQAPLPSLVLSFRDYVLAKETWQNSTRFQRDLDYWQSRIPTLPPAPELPLAKQPETIAQHRFARLSSKLDRETWLQLKTRANQAGLTPSTLFCTAYAEMLTVWGQRSHFAINILYFNRLPLHPQVNQILGNFSSTILLEVDNSMAVPFEVKAKRLQQQLSDDLEHNLVSGVQVMRELNRAQSNPSRAAMPIVFSSFLVNDTPRSQDQVANSLELNWVYGSLLTPQVFLDHQVFEDMDGTVVVNWDFVKELFPTGLVEDMFDSYLHFLHRLASSAQTWQEISPQLVPLAQLKQQAFINATYAPREEKLLHTLFITQVSKRPEQPAVVSSTATLTYQDLHLRAHQLNGQLRQLGACPNQLVAVVMEKGWEQVVGVLAILMAGAAYVPIDPALPQERRWQLLRQSEVQLVLTQSWLEEALEWPEDVQRIDVDTARKANAEEIQFSESVQQAEDLAYVIYTSGSTGLPKGVMIDHRGAVNTIVDVNQRFGVGPKDKVLALSSLSFDLSVYDIFGTLAAGGTIVLPDASGTKEPSHWLNLIQQHQVTVWNSVPALMQLLVEQATSTQISPSSLRLVMLSGDWIPLTLPPQIQTLIDRVQIISLGGATEVSIWSILYPIDRVEQTWTSIPYGRPMTNQQFYLYNKTLELCPTWVSGQLYIGGVGLAKGYWKNEEKTHANFIIHPKTGERLYRTGDLGRYLPDGNIEFLGRKDFQVKVQGYRIECGEIETTLLLHPAVQAAVVTAVGGDRQAEKSLVAYVVPSAEFEPTPHELQDFLAEKLPQYMVPSIIMLLEVLPLTSNGKVDRPSLPKPEISHSSEEANLILPRNTLELQLSLIWSEILGIHPIDMQDNFFDLGGHSFAAMRLMARIQQHFGKNLPLATFLQGSTIEHLASVLQKHTDSQGLSPLVAIQPSGERPPLFFVHPIGGHVMCYLDLALCLGEEQPFYGLQAAGLNGECKPFTRIEEMATYYLDAIRTIQSEGPYQLGGWSLGGIIAFEIAQQLSQKGEEIGLLAMVDSPYPNSINKPETIDDATFWVYVAQDFGAIVGKDLSIAVDELRQIPPGEQLNHILKQAKQLGVLPPEVSPQQMHQLLQVFKANNQALYSYIPNPYPGQLVFFSASQGDVEPTPEFIWGELLPEDLEVHRIPSDHYAIIRKPHVQSLANKLSGYLNA
ncbi:MAG: amino acid adenylation domain-containing protein [Hormoscilla sp.]